MFWFRKDKKAKKAFDSKALAKEVKFYIQSKIPGLKEKKGRYIQAKTTK